ncbi:MAG TPA: TIGR02757 family protein [Vicinamibacterales bacterium]|nr:TIGR02757 family protein [Vicinamibacterales bacterium]
MHIVRRYAAPDDREVVGFCASALAFGRVASVLHSIESLLAVMGPHPGSFVRSFQPARDRIPIDPLVHRWIRGRDLVALLLILQRMLRESGTIERFFVAGDNLAAPDIALALEAFSTRALQTDLAPAYGRVPKRPGVCYFFPRPSAGSACKRLNLFLRWMVRRDAIDLGTWTLVSPSRLIIPLDTHVIRLGRCLRLTRYSTPGWRMAAEITASLRSIREADPVRYDFSLCHVGMMNACGYGRPQGDRQCPLRGMCRPKSGARKIRTE